MKEAYLAIDFGAGSGRVMAGTCDNGTVDLVEIHRFQNRQVKRGNHLYWDFLALFADMKAGIKKAVAEGYKIKSIGIDTWGVDFGLIDKDGNLLGNPVCYRDERTNGLPEELFPSQEELEAHYAQAGIQVMSINSLFQLYSLKKNNDATLQMADKLLFMPDLFSYFLTGTANNEYCIASTSELLDARSRNWNWELIDKIGLPRHIFGEIVMPGTSRGFLKDEIAREIGVDYPVEVVAVASHDTASAVYAIRKEGVKNQAFLSSGTWSLLGAEIDEPILCAEACKAGITNEGGVDGKIRFLQNITGLWILQQLMLSWKEEGKETSYDVLIADAEKAEIASVLDVDDPIFAVPSHMENTIANYCREKGMQVPATQGEIVRVLLQSLAERYRKGIAYLNTLLPAPIESLCIIGGGSRNKLLNRLTEEATGVPVSTGGVEATAIGNILVQARRNR